jgi:hypothetical protein
MKVFHYLILFFFLTSCSSIIFADLQSAGGKKLDYAPKEILGTWFHENGGYSIEKSVIKSFVLNDSKQINPSTVEQIAKFNDDCLLFKSGEFIIANQRKNAGFWDVSIFKPLQNGDIQFWKIDEYLAALQLNQFLTLEEVVFSDGGYDKVFHTLNPIISDSAYFKKAIFSGQLDLAHIVIFSTQLPPITLKKHGAVLLPHDENFFEGVVGFQGSSSDLLNNKYTNLNIGMQEALPQEKNGRSNNLEDKIKVVRAKERNPSNNQPVLIDVYDKSLSLKVGDDIIITKTDEVQIPGEKKTIISEITVGKARITEAYNAPLYTAKLIDYAGYNMKDYKDGDENYNAVKSESSTLIISKPSIMVIPKKIEGSKWMNGEYQLSKEEKMLIAAFKNKFEDNQFTTFGFESVLKRVIENRQLNDNVLDDIKSKILESAGMDFYVEYENLDQNNTKCDRVFDFKIRNYSTGEDVASDVKNLNSCGTADEYKNFAATILNSGAVTKINKEFSALLSNGRKITILFNISNTSQAKFSKEFNGTKLGVHINNCLQLLAYKGNLDLQSESDLRKEAFVNIPVIDESNGQKYQSTTFAEEILSYLKKYAGVECDKVVSRQVITIKIK